MSGGTVEQAVRLRSGRGRGLLAAMALGSGMAFLDSTVVNVALPTIGREFDARLAALQWTVNAYTLMLAALILLGGALGDRFGRRRIFVIGASWFTVASVLCALAPTVEILIAARALQGVGGALLTPGALAILQTSIHPDDRATAIGSWAGLTGMSGILGPLLGGWLLEFDWRFVFWINVPFAFLTIYLTLRCAPETRAGRGKHGFDWAGAALGALALAASTYALIAVADADMVQPVIIAGVVTVAAVAAFLRREATARSPMVPLSLFAHRTFSVINVMTFVVYAGLSAVMFFLVIQLQTSLGWSPLAAGLASVPATLLMLVLSGRSADLATRLGVRAPLVVGALVGGAGVALLSGVGPGDSYVPAVLPGVTLLGIGLVILVPTLTATVMAAAPGDQAGVASGINNGVSRAAGLIAVAAIPAVVGLGGDGYADPTMMTDAYRSAMVICAGLLASGGVIAGVLLPRVTAGPASDLAEAAEAEEVPDTVAPCTAPGTPPVHGR
ncbi:MFS transporter [Phytoactinopolyspora limicola]|uniref:MFS transporter n=1 Tax=Phytoactinopolyspora limicola TaxID=2715536 RepID=UPI00140CF58D|nr:MFS transporter [Phytoactinopolyspora limicola]